MSYDTLAKKNYQAMMEIAPEIMNGDIEYAQYEASEGFDKLSIERLSSNMIAMAHRFEQDGDLLADPDMEFEINHEKQMLHARSYQNDIMHYYGYCVQEDGSVNDILEEEYNDFANRWMQNIKIQGYKKVVDKEEQKVEFEIVVSENGMKKNVIRLSDTEDIFKRYEDVLSDGSNSICCINLVFEEENRDGRILLATEKDIDLDALNQFQNIHRVVELKKMVRDFVDKAKEKGFQTYGRLEILVEQEQVTYRHRRGR